jgi:hypothetical protein
MSKFGVLAVIVVMMAMGTMHANAQNGLREAIEARCVTQHFQDADRATCVTEQLQAADSILEVSDFITEYEYVMQTINLGECIRESRDYYGVHYVAVEQCYERAVTASCGERPTCLANNSFEGIRQHIQNGTRP